MNIYKCLFVMLTMHFSLYSMQNPGTYFDPIINRIPVQGSIVILYDFSDEPISSFLCKERIYDLPDSFSVGIQTKKTFLLQGASNNQKSLLGKIAEDTKLKKFEIIKQKEQKNPMTAAWIAINLHTNNALSYEFCTEQRCNINNITFFQRSYKMDSENAALLIEKAKEIFKLDKVQKLLKKR